MRSPLVHRALPWLVFGLLLFGPATEALARVGGGQSFGGGGGGGGGGGYSGGGGGEGDLILLLLHLVIRYPKVGIPLVITFVLFVAVRSLWENRSGRRVVSTHHRGSASGPTHRRPMRPASILGLAHLQGRDRALSIPVLKDFLVLIHRRALEACSTGEWPPLAPFVDIPAQRSLIRQLQGIEGIRDVVLGSVQLLRVVQSGRYERLTVRFDGTRLETRNGVDRRYRVEEIWTFRRGADALSLPPDVITRLGCPSCGASVETDRIGACAQCDTPITAGQLQWQLISTEITSRRAFQPPAVGFFQGGDEPSVHLPSVEAPDLEARMRELQGIHPEFSIQAFGQRATGIYHGLQQAWSDNRWQDARPWVTDPMWQTLRFWTEQYTEHGLRNQLTEVKLTRIRVVKVEIDAWYEAITVRIWGSMKDSVIERESGKVVGGNPDAERRFSEYWTFLRAAGSGGKIHDAMACPSCAAPLDKIGQSGECGYCGSVITTGRFDWVLSSIAQCDAYNGV